MNGFGKNWVPLLCSGSSLPLHILWSYILVIHFDMGLLGVGIAGAISFLTSYILLLSYQHSQEDFKETIVLMDSKIIDREDLTQFIHLALPSLAINSLNWWIWEVCILFAGLLSVN
jgi:MATE family multidrug resistance protein